MKALLRISVPSGIESRTVSQMAIRGIARETKKEICGRGDSKLLLHDWTMAFMHDSNFLLREVSKKGNFGDP